MLMNMSYTVIYCSSLLGVAFFSLFERKMIGFSQSRKGPNKVWQGLGQPISDALKLLSKTEVTPLSVMKFPFFISPIVMFLCSSCLFMFMPIIWGGTNMKYGWGGIMILFCLSVYGLIMSGWLSNSKFSWLGCIRSMVQSLSYEVGLSFILCMLFVMVSTLWVGCFTVFQFKNYLWLSWAPLLILMMIIFLAELNRSPFDLSEGESELVSGYSVEYGGLSYTLIFLAENLSLLWGSVMIGVIFSIWLIPLMVWVFVWVRATEPRTRFDKMMSLFWKILLPLLLTSLLMYMSVW